MADFIIQWNCSGLQTRFNDVKLILASFNPKILCLQETNILPPDPNILDDEGKVKESYYLKFKGYQGYHSYATNENGKAHGGASIWVWNGIPHKELKIDSPLQAASVQIDDGRKISVSSIYVLNNTTPSLETLNNFKNQLPPPFIISGDYNAHSPVWGNVDVNGRGKEVEKFINENDDVVIFNDGKPTYISPQTGNGSVIDLCLCHPDILLDYKFKVADDLSGSDHFPIILETIDTTPPDPIERWNFNKADWAKFDKLCLEKLILINVIKLSNSTGVDLMDAFIKILFDISKEAIPRYVTKPKRSYPWFTDECRSVIRARKQAQRLFHRQPSNTNKIRYKELCAQARRTLKQAKKQSWAEYVSKFNKDTNVKKTWDMVRKITGKNQSQPIKFIKTPEGDITSKQAIAEKIGQTVEKNSSSQHYTTKFQNFKAGAERKKINFGTSSDDYNKKFSDDELIAALQRAKNGATGPGDIHYMILKRLPPESISVLCHIFNHFWQEDSFPSSWREALIIPVPKPNKDSSDPENIRPIALTCCICKTMERMINTRLVSYLEKHKILTKYQCGFRKGRSTADQLD